MIVSLSQPDHQGQPGRAMTEDDVSNIGNARVILAEEEKGMRWILASASPRRRELLQQMGLRNFDIIPAQGEESSRAEDPGRYVEELSQRKAVEVYHRVTAGDDRSVCAMADEDDRIVHVKAGDDNRPALGRTGSGIMSVSAMEDETAALLEGTEWDAADSSREIGADSRICVIGADTIVVCDGKILGKPTDRTDAARMIRMLQGRSHEVMTGVSLIWSGPDEGNAAREEKPFSSANSISMCPDDGKSACRDAGNSVRPGGEDAGQMLRHKDTTYNPMAHGPMGEAAGRTIHHKDTQVDRPDSSHIRTFHVETKVRVAPMDEKEIRRYLETGEADDKAGAYGIQGAFGTFIEGIEGDYYNVVGLPIARLYQEIRKENFPFS